MTNSNTRKLRFVVFTPYHEGFYYGEVINHIRMLCKLKHYALDVISTHGFGEYDSLYGVAHSSAVIIIRNAISQELAGKLGNMDIPCVSIGYDYFPARINIVCSDNRQGMELAFDHLVDKGHTRIAYMGDLTQYDLRKRYEVYCERHAAYNLSLDEELVFLTKSITYLGGFNAANEFVQRNCDATALIIGAGLVAEGFKSQMNEINPQLYDRLDIVSFDLMPLQILSKKSTKTIDLNLLILANNCINVIERRLASRPVENLIKVDCRLVELPAYGEVTPSDMAPCLEEASFNNPPYMKILVTKMYEWPIAIANTALNDIMSLAPLFDRLLQMAILVRFVEEADGSRNAQLVKVFERHATHVLDGSEPDSVCPLNYAPECFVQHFDDANYELTTSIPVVVNGKVWGVFTAFGANEIGNGCNNYLAYIGYLDLTIQFFTQNMLAKLASSRSADAWGEVDHKESKGIVVWDYVQGVVEWSDDALKLLGLTSMLEKNIYRNMDIDDRVHQEDQTAMREMVHALHESGINMFITVRIKAKSGTFSAFNIKGGRDEATKRMLFELQPVMSVM